MSLNKVMLIGRLGKDPELRYLENNVAVARFTLATSEFYKDSNGQRVEKTEWHNIVVWRGLADVAGKFLKKGSQLYVEGKLTNRSYDGQNGEKKYVTEIVANDFRMLDNKKEGENQIQGGQSNTASYKNTGSSQRVSEPRNPMDEMEDDLPF